MTMGQPTQQPPQGFTQRLDWCVSVCSLVRQQISNIITNGISNGVINGPVSTPTMQVYNTNTSGMTVTVNNGVAGMYVDPITTIVGGLTIVAPSSPIDGQQCVLIFGGHLTTGSVVTGGVTISPGSRTDYSTEWFFFNSYCCRTDIHVI